MNAVPSMPASAPVAQSPSSRGVREAGSHSGPCHCGDDAQLHYALIARDLMRRGRENELTDTMRQAYDYEFGGVREPEPIQIPEF